MIRRETERGSALIASLLFVVVVLGLVSAILSSGIAVQRQTRYMVARQGAQEAAESGVHLALAKLGGPQAGVVLGGGLLEGVIRGSGERAPSYYVTLTPAGTDGADNDLDGVTDETDEHDMVEVASTGRYDGVMRTVRVTLLARYRTPEFPSATYIADPGADLTFNGNSFLISGVDVDLNGGATGMVVPGIGVNGPTNFLVEQISKKQTDNVVGQGGSPSVATVAEIDLRDLVEEGARAANVVLDPAGGTHQPASAGAWGTIGAPAIVYSPGSIHVSGGAAGAGYMIVNGDLTITGGFEWRGLIIVRGRVEFKGGGGGKRLTGAMVLQSDLFQQLPSEEANGGEGMNMSGTVDVLFSEQTLTRISTVFRSYSILNWREGPNPDFEALP
jgi:hypothetical protein